ncbi:hypothetical protein AKJ56_00285 [candidate division MSBL1 archaeon SCGC-AAA382N08]|uniref:Transcription regulator AsnC/Lrp ligand binding domain-containing protein n=1 Tax=candidate division MSBL1 archaeon SCGC-AAA382N08 TaxID=1698285 RepID=A0A133VQT0_9EURY|nr:hypothetical protein AKJ56_00285 [candidate division MSBL1 archaeon SCGC-AAA382N08]
MPLAYILITTKVGEMKRVVEGLRELDRIKEANMFTGPYDIIAITETESMGIITGILMKKIHKIPGIKETTTCIQIEE